jgi:hypothetical protein
VPKLAAVAEESMTTIVKDDDRSFLGHPKALAFLASTEAWERFSYYGMQSLLVLYMTKTLLLSPHVEQIAGFSAFQAVIQAVYHPGLLPLSSPRRSSGSTRAWSTSPPSSAGSWRIGS